MRRLDERAEVAWCPDCGELRPVERFYVRRTADGMLVDSYCKEHARQRATASKRRWREANPEAARATRQQWRAANPEADRASNRACHRRWRERHKDLVAAQHRLWQLANPEANRAKARRHYQKKRKAREEDAV